MQNEQTLQQMIREFESNMPSEIMDLIKSFDWKKEVRMIVNQNQLMIDTGADLEQSIYLMILGAVQVSDLYQRLIEMHELPEDKAQKIIQEIEVQIFEPLHKKLIELDEKNPVENVASSKDIANRNTILAEIEKEPEPLIKLNFDMKEEEKSPIVQSNPQIDTGIVKSFSINPTKDIENKDPLLAQDKVVEGVQKDPVTAGLTSPTITQVQTPPVAAVDPYRELI